MQAGRSPSRRVVLPAPLYTVVGMTAHTAAAKTPSPEVFVKAAPFAETRAVPVVVFGTIAAGLDADPMPDTVAIVAAGNLVAVASVVRKDAVAFVPVGSLADRVVTSAMLGLLMLRHSAREKRSWFLLPVQWKCCCK